LQTKPKPNTQTAKGDEQGTSEAREGGRKEKMTEAPMWIQRGETTA